MTSFGFMAAVTILGAFIHHVMGKHFVNYTGAAIRKVLIGKNNAAHVGAYLSLVAPIEAQLWRDPGDPANSLLSPLLKAASEIVVIICATFLGGILILFLSAAALAISMIYGSWGWHTVNVMESSHSH